MIYRFLLALGLLIGIEASAQDRLMVRILDQRDGEALIGATILLKGTENGAISDINGLATLTNIPNGQQSFELSFIGYQSKTLNYLFPLRQTAPVNVFLVANDSELGEVVVEATRANKTISNLPTRTEVLTDEIDEAASMEPSKVAHLLTHSTGIQVQTTSASSNGAVVRIQGLNGRYTQLLRDGFPLYGGFSGSLDVLQIPPLDLRQVEFVKGSASTLYGGGAIGGLVNMLTKKADRDETLLHMNYSHIGARDFNAFISRRRGKFGFTNLASLHIHNAYDADDDGYSDVPEIAKFAFNPKFFYNPNERTEFYLGASITVEERMGGDMDLINNQSPSLESFYYDRQNSSRYSTQFSASYDLSDKANLSFKNAVSLFQRAINIRQNIFGTEALFSGTQLNTWNEFSYNRNTLKHNLSLGLNLSTDNFNEDEIQNTKLRNQDYLTLGLFANHLWDISDDFSLESGLRTDYAIAEGLSSKNGGESFVLPRLNALYKLSRSWSLRLGGGLGYRMPTLFNEEAEPLGFFNVNGIDFNQLTAERSYGSNFDIKYVSDLGIDGLLLTYNLMFFYNLIDNPITLSRETAPSQSWTYSQINDLQSSRGFESQIKLSVWKLTWFLGYTYSYAAFENSNQEDQELILTPRHSIKGDLLFIEEGKWRIGLDYEYKSGQILSDNSRSGTLFTTGFLVERTIDNLVIFLNAENFTDTRQTRFASLLSDPYGTPQLTDIWAPLDGFFFNAGLKIKL